MMWKNREWCSDNCRYKTVNRPTPENATGWTPVGDCSPAGFFIEPKNVSVYVVGCDAGLELKHPANSAGLVPRKFPVADRLFS